MKTPLKILFIFIVAFAGSLLLNACETLPKMETLEPLPEYPEDIGGWDTDASCFVTTATDDEPPLDRIVEALNAANYTAKVSPQGYLTRQIRLSVDKALAITYYELANKRFSDGSCVDGMIEVLVHDTHYLKQYGPFVAQARAISEEITLSSIPGGKELLEQIQEDPEKISEVPALLDNGSDEIQAFWDANRVFIVESDVFNTLMDNLLCQPEFRAALTKK